MVLDHNENDIDGVSLAADIVKQLLLESLVSVLCVVKTGNVNNLRAIAGIDHWDQVRIG